MASSGAEMKNTQAIKPHQTMRGHADAVTAVAHLPGGRRIITCSWDGSLRLWDLERDTQIDDTWRDGESETGVLTIVLSPNGKTIASGSSDGTVILWDVETRKVISKWSCTKDVCSLCWRADGERVVSGSGDGTVSVWDAESGELALGPIKTGDISVSAVIYSPDTTKIATCGSSMGMKIWDANTGELRSTIEHEHAVWSLAWTSDQKKLISGALRSIRIFDTATWQQIAVLEGHTDFVYSLSLFQNGRLLASASHDNTARLWNLDTNLPVGPPLQHQNWVSSAAISADGKLLVTGCNDHNTYIWDIETILTEVGLEDLLSIPDNVSSVDTDAAQLPNDTHGLPKGFFEETRGDVQSPHAFAPSSPLRPHTFLSRLASLFHRPQPNTNQATALQQPARRSIFSRHHPRPPVVEVAAAQDKQTLYVARPGGKGKQQQQGQLQGQASTFQIPPVAVSMSTIPPPDVSGTTAPPPAVSSTTTAGAAGTQSQPTITLAWWKRSIIFVCCAC